MGQVAFVFTGQGAQYAGMGEGLYAASPAARQVFDAAEALRPGTLETCFHGPQESLNVTLNTQPCLMAMDAACAAALREAGVQPDALAGFSLGEIAALPMSGLLSFEDAFRLVCKRAELMQRCAEATPGGMVAVLKLTDEQVEALCGEQGAYPVNYNCPGQVVCALRKDAIPAFSAAVKAAGGRALPLAVSGGFHSPFMHEAALGLSEYASTLSFAEPAVQLYANAISAPYTAAEAASLLGRQVESPVRWTQLIHGMQAAGVTDFVEVGAGKTLSGLIGKIGGAARVLRVEDVDTLRETVRTLKEEPAC
ncbi:MAG: ACP S-malonyltransferase [Eubacteriales bacterium]|nr:ACP S-malonyltransferase [Eubacteriales bacterium]